MPIDDKTTVGRTPALADPGRRLETFREEVGLPAKAPDGYENVEFGVKAEGRWVVLTLGSFGTMRLEPADALAMGRALKSCALRVRAQRKV